MEKRRLSTADQRVWDLHMQGFDIPRVASMTGRGEADVHAVIVGEWHDDKMAARAAKRTRAA